MVNAIDLTKTKKTNQTNLPIKCVMQLQTRLAITNSTLIRPIKSLIVRSTGSLTPNCVHGNV